MSTSYGRDTTRPKRPTKSEDGAFEELMNAVPTEAQRLAGLSDAAFSNELARARASAWGRLKESEYQKWNSALVVQIWRLQGRIPEWTAPQFVGETPEGAE